MKPRILIVDDDETNRVLLTAKLERVGYEVEQAVNGLQALEKTSAFHPDLILMDIMMPVMDGYEVLRRLKSGESTRYIPVVLITGKSEVEDKVMGFEVGAEDYISKPYSLQEVAARVKSLLRMRALQTRLRETEKVAALGSMVDGIAHELRNPLVAIGGMARRLYEHEADAQHKEYAGRIIKSVERLERLILRIDEYKRILSSTLARGDLNDVIEAAVKEIRDYVSGTGKEITVRPNLMPEPPPVNFDFGNLKTAILNVLQNSVEAIDKKGEITIETLPAFDQTLILKIIDTGCGIKDEDLRNVFNPFQTSKLEGAGLGLTITYRIIQDHGGEIDITSKAGIGTTVIIRLHPAERGRPATHAG